MAKIILCRGIQGSGKTTWAKQWVLEDPEHRVRFNNDDVRNMLGKYWVPSREHLVQNLKITLFIDVADNKYDIVIDNMNLNSREVEEWQRLAKAYDYELEFKDFFNVSLEECILRDSKRENPIGEEVIRKTYERYKSIIEGV